MLEMKRKNTRNKDILIPTLQVAKPVTIFMRLICNLKKQKKNKKTIINCTFFLQLKAQLYQL